MIEAAEMKCHCGMKMPEDIARTEKIEPGGETPDGSREWIIRTYCRCLQAVRNPMDAAAILAAYAPPTGRGLVASLGSTGFARSIGNLSVTSLPFPALLAMAKVPPSCAAKAPIN